MLQYILHFNVQFLCMSHSNAFLFSSLAAREEIVSIHIGTL